MSHQLERPERRRRGRYLPRGMVASSPLIEGRILNLSAGGLAIETSCYLRIGGSYFLSLLGTAQPRPVRAFVRWARLQATHPSADGDVTPIYRCGLSIEPALESDSRS